jgi:hypothetical protein
LISTNFGESDLGPKANRLLVLSNFVDEVLRGNARNWEEKKSFFSYQDLAVRWSTSLARKIGDAGSTSENGAKGNGNKKKPFAEKQKPRIPGWICKRFNEGRCESKDDKHQSTWDAAYTLKHLCSKWLRDKNRCCMEPHPEIDHK